MSHTLTLHCLSEAIAPITHMSGTEGNEAIVAREEIATPKGKIKIPYLSGNAIRHRMLREPGGMWTIYRCGLDGKLSIEQLNFLLHGGNLTEGGGREDTRRIADMQRISPLLRLLGGSLPDQILAGSLKASRGMLVCEENAHHLSGHIPAEWREEFNPLLFRSGEHFISGYQYTRGDAVKTGLAPIVDEERNSNLMIYNGQCVMRGAAFLHGFHIDNATDLEVGALLHCLNTWQSTSGGTIGGMASKGHGKLQMHILGFSHPEGKSMDELIGEYEAHVTDHKQEFTDWLNKAFAKKPPKEPKPKKGKEATDGKK